MPTDDVADTQLLDAAQYRAENEVKVPIGGGRHVLCRKVDMPTLVLEGVLPMPLLTAVQKLAAGGGDLSPMELLDKVTTEEKQEMVLMLRKYACIAIMKPAVTEVDTGNPNFIPVTMFGVEVLVQIWSATALIPLVGAADAARFRPTGVVDDAPAAPARADVSPEPELVALTGADVRSA